MAYNRNRTKPMSPKEKARVADLIDMHNKGVIDLNVGPWRYYGYDVGNPSAFLKPTPRDYSKCLISPPLTTCQTTS